MRSVVSTMALALLLSGFGFAKSVIAEGWKWVPADPPVTLPDLVSNGGQVEAWEAGRASNFIPGVEAEADFVASAILILHDRKLYRCITQDGESVGDGNCFVAANK